MHPKVTNIQSECSRIGVISDTHGILHPALPELFEPVTGIIHAGDIGQPDILESLGRIAPVTAVRGNMDFGSWAADLPAMAIVEVDSLRLCVLHDISQIDFDPQQNGIRAVISGHTHRPRVRAEGAVLFVNPGSASHPQYRHPPTVALIEVVAGNFRARLIELQPLT